MLGGHMNKDKAIIDGSNLSYLEAPKQPRANIKSIFDVMRAVEARGLEPVVVIDPDGRSVVDANDLQRLLEERSVVKVPSDSDQARVVLEMALKHNAVIVSNNAYVDYLEE